MVLDNYKSSIQALVHTTNILKYIHCNTKLKWLIDKILNILWLIIHLIYSDLGNTGPVNI